MNRIVFITIAGLVFSATAAAAYQVNGRHENKVNRCDVQNVNYTGKDCPMTTGKSGRGMMGFGMVDTTSCTPVDVQVHLSQQGRTGSTGTDK